MAKKYNPLVKFGFDESGDGAGDAAVTSVNGQTGDVTINIPTPPVTSVNGQTGAVTINIPTPPVTSVNGQTGAVTINIPTPPVTSVNGQTGAVVVEGGNPFEKQFSVDGIVNDRDFVQLNSDGTIDRVRSNVYDAAFSTQGNITDPALLGIYPKVIQIPGSNRYIIANDNTFRCFSYVDGVFTFGTAVALDRIRGLAINPDRLNQLIVCASSKIYAYTINDLTLTLSIAGVNYSVGSENSRADIFIQNNIATIFYGYSYGDGYVYESFVYIAESAFVFDITKDMSDIGNGKYVFSFLEDKTNIINIFMNYNGILRVARAIITANRLYRPGNFYDSPNFSFSTIATGITFGGQIFDYCEGFYLSVPEYGYASSITKIRSLNGVFTHEIMNLSVPGLVTGLCIDKTNSRFFYLISMDEAIYDSTLYCCDTLTGETIFSKPLNNTGNEDVKCVCTSTNLFLTLCNLVDSSFMLNVNRLKDFIFSRVLGVALEHDENNVFDVMMLGGIVPGFEGLTPGQLYYIDIDGNLTTTTSDCLIGRAISDTEIETIKTFNQ